MVEKMVGRCAADDRLVASPFPLHSSVRIYPLFSVFVLLAQAAPVTAVSPAPAHPSAQTETVTIKKVCREIEVPMSRMPKRVCQKVTVKKPDTPGEPGMPGAPATPSGN